MKKSEIKTKKLFEEILQNPNQNKNQIFEKLAILWNMNKNSIRNMYYLQLEKMRTDDKLTNKLGIDIKQIKKQEFNLFTEQDKENLIKDILKYQEMGKSVRYACLTLARGEIDEMIRLQNKYRSIYNKEPEYLESVAQKYNISYKKSILPSNVIPFKSKEKSLSDSEINSLFLGLVRLIKTNSIKDVNQAIKDQYRLANTKIRIIESELKKTKEELNEERRKTKKLELYVENVEHSKIVKSYQEFLKTLKIKKEAE